MKKTIKFVITLSMLLIMAMPSQALAGCLDSAASGSKSCIGTYGARGDCAGLVQMYGNSCGRVNADCRAVCVFGEDCGEACENGGNCKNCRGSKSVFSTCETSWGDCSGSENSCMNCADCGGTCENDCTKCETSWGDCSGSENSCENCASCNGTCENSGNCENGGTCENGGNGGEVTQPQHGSFEWNRNGWFAEKEPAEDAGEKEPVEQADAPAEEVSEPPADADSNDAGKPADTPESVDVANAGMAGQILSLVNQERAAAGLGALTLNSDVSRVAQAKAEDMAVNGYFSHTSPTYGSPFEMMTSFGVGYSAAGENIAKGYSSAAAVMDGWMNSSGHRANILSESYTELGVGYYVDGNGTAYWVQTFRRP